VGRREGFRSNDLYEGPNVTSGGTPPKGAGKNIYKICTSMNLLLDTTGVTFTLGLLPRVLPWVLLFNWALLPRVLRSPPVDFSIIEKL
jgi:hypothetical protein